MTKASIRQPPSPTMRRRLGMSFERGWQVRLHGGDCTAIDGTVASLDDHALRCVIIAPDSLCPEREVGLDEICDVEVLSMAMMLGSRLQARFAVIAPWRGGSSDPATVIADLLSGSVAPGEQGVLLLSNGVRRQGRFAGMEGRFWRFALGEASSSRAAVR